MTSWSSGYVTDIGYTYGVYRELVPALLSFAALSAGIAAPDPAGPLRYCELGCGQGFSANLLAAANPGIEFHATDFNPTHIAGAMELAAAAGTPNVRFYDRSFADFGAEPGLPEFDIIALHGVYSWVSAENRRHIVKFIKDRLKIGGLVYISYNALPGWASVLPLRRLMTDRANGVSGPIAAKVDAAFAYADRLAAVGAGYFQANPGVTDLLARIKDQDRSYVAHEYFNRDLTPFYHEDVAADLDEAKLSFVCSAYLADSLSVANLTSEQQNFLGGIGTLSEREKLRDFIVNKRFRRDVFIKGALPLSPGDLHRRWDGMRFVLSTRREEISLRIKGVLGEATLKEEVYAPILDALADGPRTTRELAADPRMAALSRPILQQALTVLVGINHVQPALDAAGEAGRAVSVRKFNTAVMDKARSTRDLVYLASPVTGAGVEISRISQLFLLAGQEGHDDPPAFAWEQLSRIGHKVARDGKPLDTADENLAELRELFDQFNRRRLPLLRSLGIAGSIGGE